LDRQRSVEVRVADRQSGDLALVELDVGVALAALGRQGEHRLAQIDADDRPLRPNPLEGLGDVEARPAARVEHAIAGAGAQRLVDEGPPAQDVALAIDDLHLSGKLFVELELSHAWSLVAWQSVRIATWNVNSVKQRLPRLLPWLEERRPDVVCLQETKLADEAFAELLGEDLSERGYEVATHGEATWNGVAILSRAGLDDVVRGLAGAPGFPHPEARAIAATCGGVRVVSVYVPNGRVPGSEHYEYKLAWLQALRAVVAERADSTIVCGDMNIAPTDDDVFDPEAYEGETHVTPPERAALADLQSVGLRDVVRDRWPGERIFTYWDYRAGMFHQDLGMRIDLVLAGEPVAGRVRAAWVDRQARKGSGPSDHAPVIVDLDEAPDGDIGPVVPPPSRPVIKRGAKKLPQAKA
jgi:exodeoxyribonuclease-3